MSAAPAVLRRARCHFYWVDWLRFLAAFLVLINHVCQLNWYGPGLDPSPTAPVWQQLLAVPIHLGREAVVVFFVLSGALVGGLTLEKIRAGTFELRAYAADRLARVYVPLLPALLLSIAVLRMCDLPVLPAPFLGCLLGLQGVATHVPLVNVVLWTLTYEVWFYVLAGCAGVLAAWPRQGRAARGAALAGGALSLWLLCFPLDGCNLICWLVGAFGFGLRHRLGAAARLGSAAAGLTLMALVLVGRQTNLLPLAGSAPWRDAVAYLTLSLGTLLLVLGVCRSAPRTRLAARLERAGTVLASFSYTLYVVHFPILSLRLSLGPALEERASGPTLLHAFGSAALCVLVALGMYALFERQTPRVRRWLRARLGAAAWPPPEPAAMARPALAAGSDSGRSGRARNLADAYQEA